MLAQKLKLSKGPAEQMQEHASNLRVTIGSVTSHKPCSCLGKDAQRALSLQAAEARRSYCLDSWWPCVQLALGILVPVPV